MDNNFKKMYLVDERTFKSGRAWINDKIQETAWSKPPEKKSKTAMHASMHDILENDRLADDEKAKLYHQQFIRFLYTTKPSEMPPTPVIKPEPVAKPKPVASEPTPETKQLSKKKQRKQKAVEPQEVWQTPKPRRSARKRKPAKWDSIYNE